MSCVTVQTNFSPYTNIINNKKPHLHPKSQALALPPLSRSYSLHSLLFYTNNPQRIVKSKRSSGLNVVCQATPISTLNLQWISAISSVVLLLARVTAVPKPFIVPLFALQAPASIVAWTKGRYGVWTAFLALLVRLFFVLPGELELLFVALLLLIVAPSDVMKLRGTQQVAIILLLIAGYVAFQHFSRVSLRKAFDQGSIVATLAVISITVASLLLLI